MIRGIRSSRLQGRTIALTAAVVALFAVFASSALAMSNDPIGFEGADGNQVVNTAGQSDWANLAAQTGLPITHVSDATGSSDDTFSGSSENSPEGWSYAQGAASGKGDILNFWADSHPPIASASNSPSGFLYLGFERTTGNTNSDASIEFEVNQSIATWTNPSHTVVPCRTNGDLLISYDISPSGGGVSTAGLTAYQWHSTGGTPACPGGEGNWTKPNSAPITNEFEGAMSFAGTINNCLSGDCSNLLQPGTFGEAAIDINGLMTAAGWTPGTCVQYVQSQVRSRTSNSISSSLSDSVAPIQLADPLNGCAAPDPGHVNPTMGNVTAGGNGTDGQLAVSWLPAYQGDSDLTGYTVVITDSQGNPVGSPINVGPTVTSTVINGLTNGAQYTATVTATNANNLTDSKADNGSPYGKPGPPTNVSATAGDGTATVTWSPPTDDHGSPITGYDITSSTGQTIHVGAGERSVTFTGLVDGQTYTFTVNADNAAGSGPSVGSNAVTPLAAAVDNSGPVGPSTPQNTGGEPTGTQVVAGSQVSLVARKRCVDRRKFKFKLHHAPGQPVVKVVAFVNGKRKLTKKGTDVTSFTLRKLPKGKFKVKIIATQASGSKITSTRTYKGCKKSKPKSKGHHHRHH